MTASHTASPAPCAASADPGDKQVGQARPSGRGLVIDRLLRGQSRRMRKPAPMPITSIAMAQPIAFFHTGLW